nr:translation initiation factor IF-2-like [Aegilops tauschii subsp. strangulata]
MPAFDKFGLVRAGPPLPPTSLVDLSSGDQSSEATEDEVVEESSAPRQRELLRDFPDDDDDDAPPVVEVPRPSGVTTRAGVSSSKQPKRTATKKGRTMLIPPGSVPPSPTASRVAPTASSPAPKSSAPAAPSRRPLLGLKRSYVFADQQQSSKKQKEGAEVAVVEGAEVAAAALAKESAAAPAAPALISSPQGVEAHPQEVPTPSAGLTPPAPILAAAAEVAQPPEPLVLPDAESGHGAPATFGALEEARAALNLLQGELRGPDRRSALGRLGLISGWLQADAFVRAAWGSAEEDQKVLGVVATERDLARKEATEAEDWCRVVEAELKALQDQRAAQASQLQEREEKLKAQEAALADRNTEVKKAALGQAVERDRLTRLKEEAEAAQAALAEAKKVAAMDSTLASLEARFHKAQRSLFGDDPLKKATTTTPRESPAALLPEVLAVLEDAVDGFGSLVESEARSLSSLALTCVFSHLYLPDAGFDFSSFLAPVDSDSQDAPAAAMKGSVDAMLGKFLVVGPTTGAEGTGDARDDGAPLAGDGGTQV